MSTADFTSHHIEGYARAAQERGLPGYFSCPLITQVAGNLWQGGCRDGVRLPHDFRYVISLYPWERYTLGPNTERVEIEMLDGAQVPDEKQLYEIATQVNVLAQEGKTLVHCQAGLNRSGLVTGLALLLAGVGNAEECIALMRLQRCDMVLCNGHFEHWLLQQAPVAA